MPFNVVLYQNFGKVCGFGKILRLVLFKVLSRILGTFNTEVNSKTRYLPISSPGLVKTMILPRADETIQLVCNGASLFY